MTSEQYLKDSTKIIDALEQGMNQVARDHGLEYEYSAERNIKAKEDLKGVFEEYGILFAIEQLEVAMFPPEEYEGDFVVWIEEKITDLKSKLTNQ